jgi:8-oxo-dGTP pyrophosphatase MutT (NUDIX family)
VSVTAAAVLADLAAHRPGGEWERRSLARARAMLQWLPRPLDQDADPTHVTGSAIVLDGRGRVLLHRHKRLGIWLQPGGHLDPGEHPCEAARRETLEETGVAADHPAAGPHLLHVDVHEGPRGHVHLDLRYLLHGDGDAPLRPAPGESPDVAWVARDEVPRLADASLVAAVRAAPHPDRASDAPAPAGRVTTRRGGPR